MEGDERGTIQLQGHLGELLLRELVAGDRLAEDHPLLRVLERRLEARPPGADCPPDDSEARLVEARERPAQRRRVRKDVVVRHAHVLQHELGGDGGAERELLVDLGSREAWKVLLDDEAPDRALVGAGPDDRDVGDRAVRDPHLRAVQDPVRAVAARVCPHRARVGAGIGLGQAEAADHVSRVHRRQPPLLLLLGAPAPDREHRERPLDRDGAADAGVAGLELHAREPVCHRLAPGSPYPSRCIPSSPSLASSRIRSFGK